jgi:hypothetical protein
MKLTHKILTVSGITITTIWIAAFYLDKVDHCPYSDWRAFPIFATSGIIIAAALIFFTEGIETKK